MMELKGSDAMLAISPKILRDENENPVAVQIPYEDWLEIKKKLSLHERQFKIVDLTPHIGVIKLTEDPLEFQQRIRAEWD
jgi:hypothetical protein